MMTRSALILLAALVSGPAFSADAPYSRAARGIIVLDDVHLPPCNSPGVFRKISWAFRDKESEYWNSDLQLQSFEAPTEIGLRPWGPEFIPRRFCQARVMVSDGQMRTVYYSVGKDTGTLGIFDGVDWCVTGLDRNLAFSPNCRMARP
jgi:hypothetical protein